MYFYLDTNLDQNGFSLESNRSCDSRPRDLCACPSSPLAWCKRNEVTRFSNDDLTRKISCHEKLPFPVISIPPKKVDHARWWVQFYSYSPRYLESLSCGNVIARECGNCLWNDCLLCRKWLNLFINLGMVILVVIYPPFSWVGSHGPTPASSFNFPFRLTPRAST